MYVWFWPTVPSHSPHGTLGSGSKMEGSGEEQEDGLVLGTQLQAQKRDVVCACVCVGHVCACL
jgi:hypothetical protein